MIQGIYITHPEVVIDPDIPTPKWGLSAVGHARARDFAQRHLLPNGIRIVSSTETKALDLATALSEVTGSAVESDPAFGENDRSSTGFLRGEEFETQVGRLFGQPSVSANGWETAIDAQRRVVKAVSAVLAEHKPLQPVIFTGHGCVGTLLKCHIAGRPIAQSEDQRVVAHAGGGNIFAFSLAPKKLICEWTPMEDWKERLT